MDALSLAWLSQKIDALPVEGRWHALARGSLKDELQSQSSTLVAQVLRSADGNVDQRVANWIARDDVGLRFAQSMFAEMHNLREMDYATVSVALRRLAQLSA